jgi:hypothetical protein
MKLKCLNGRDNSGCTTTGRTIAGVASLSDITLELSRPIALGYAQTNGTFEYLASFTACLEVAMLK